MVHQNMRLPMVKNLNLPFHVDYPSSNRDHQVALIKPDELRVNIVQRQAGEDVYSLELPYHPRQQYDAYPHEMVKAYIAAGTLVVSQPWLRLIAADGVLLYEIDLSKLLENYGNPNVVAISQMNNFQALHLSIAESDQPHAARYLTVADLRPLDAEQCDQVYNSQWQTTPTRCDREQNHLTGHYALRADDGFIAWSSGGGQLSPRRPYGIIHHCPECGMANLTNDGYCETDAYWRAQAKERNQAFIVTGRHYRPGKGGFGGTKFNVRKQDGSLWQGELFTQGDVPIHWRNRLPDNAAFEHIGR